MSSKRSRSSSIDQQDQAKRVRTEPNLLSELSQVLNTITSTPSSGEISAEVMENFKVLLLEIDQLSSDDAETQRMKQESELCLESWFDDLLARCEADGELDLKDLESLCESDDEEQDQIAFAMVEEDEDEEEIIIVDDEGSEVGQPLAVL